MSEKNWNLLVRVASAVVLLPVVLWLLYRGGSWSGALFAFAAGACAYEYLTIVLKDPRSPIVWLVVGTAGAMPFLPVVAPASASQLAVGLTGFVLFSAWTWHLWRGPRPEAPLRIAHLLMAFVYGAGGLTALSALRGGPDGGWWVVATLVITWGNDTAAYFFGRLLGRHRLFPEVSPSKTWEGFLGGFVGSIGILFLQRAYFFPELTTLDCLILGGLASVLGPVGDLSESMLKRAHGVKDSGRIIPGHGGMLDRLDALIFNAPMVLLYVQFGRGLVG